MVGDCYQFDKLHRTRKYAKQLFWYYVPCTNVKRNTHIHTLKNRLEQMNEQTKKKWLSKIAHIFFWMGFFILIVVYQHHKKKTLLFLSPLRLTIASVDIQQFQITSCYFFTFFFSCFCCGSLSFIASEIYYNVYQFNPMELTMRKSRN